MNEYARHLLQNLDSERLGAGVLHPKYCDLAYLVSQLERYEKREYRATDTKLLPRVLWILALEEQVRSLAKASAA